MAIPGLRSGWNLGKWQDHLAVLYKEQNRARSPLETLTRVVEMGSGMARGVREDDPDVLKLFAPRTLSWILGLSTQLEVNLEEALWNSYPGVCTHCHDGAGCSCRVHPEKRRRLIDKNEIQSLQQKMTMPQSLPDWQAMFKRIYSTMNRTLGAEKCVLHFLEELGEVSEAIRYKIAPDSPYPAEKIDVMLRNELSDLFAWFIGLTNMKRMEIDAYMRDIYEYSCPECGKSPCTCHPYHVHPQVRLGGKGV